MRVVGRDETGPFGLSTPVRTGLQTSPSHVALADPVSMCVERVECAQKFSMTGFCRNAARAFPPEDDFLLELAASTSAGIQMLELQTASS